MLVLLFVIALIVCFALDRLDSIYTQLVLGSLLIVGLILASVSRKQDRDFKRFPFNDGGLGD